MQDERLIKSLLDLSATTEGKPLSAKQLITMSRQVGRPAEWCQRRLSALLATDEIDTVAAKIFLSSDRALYHKTNGEILRRDEKMTEQVCILYCWLLYFSLILVFVRVFLHFLYGRKCNWLKQSVSVPKGSCGSDGST